MDERALKKNTPGRVTSSGIAPQYAARIIGFLVLAFVAGCHTPPKPYPLGIYSVGNTNDLSVIREAGFNLVTGGATTDYLDAANQLGLKVLASPGTSAGDDFNSATARRTVLACDSHPALWAWYLIDEPDLNAVSPEQVKEANRFIKNLPGTKPTALVIFNGSSAIHYANITDVMMIDRYPIPWLPLANFPQHVRLTRLALGQKKPLIAVIQAFDWKYYRELLREEKDFRVPTYEELRCMTFCALAQRANGIFYYAFDASGWKMAEHPEVWEPLKKVVAEVNNYTPLFQAEHLWWPVVHRFQDTSIRFNAALESSITPALLQVRHGNHSVPKGRYMLTVNNTPKTHVYSFRLSSSVSSPIPVLGEAREVQPEANWVKDEFAPYAIHIYGPLPEL